MRYFYTNKGKLLFIFFPIILSSLMLVVFVPEYQAFALVLEICLILSLGVIFATLSFNFTNSTIYNNLKISNNNKYNFNISVFISMIISSLLLLFLLLILLTIFSEMKILETSWLKYDYDTFHFSFFNRAIWIAIISTIEISSILFSISFFFTKISNSEKAYYILILCLVIFSFFFGGSTINSFFWPGANDDGIYSYMSFKESTSHSILFPLSLFFPFFSPGVISFIYSQFSLRNINDQFGQFQSNAWEHLRIISWQTKSIVPQEFWPLMWRWNIVLILPVIWVSSFGMSGILISKFGKNS